MRKIIATFFISTLFLSPLYADNLVIVSAFPKDINKTLIDAFNKKYPNITVDVVQKKTPAAVKYVQETRANNTIDLVWSSAPDAFEVLKDDGLLENFKPSAAGIPKLIGSYPINDPDGYYTGFAAGGFGIMYNLRYLDAKQLPIPRQWEDLLNPIYKNHVGMSAPSRSGTTHLTIETLLQGYGFDKGWAMAKKLAGNYKIITERSFGVPAGVNNGEFGIGITVDYNGLTSIASGFPVGYIYPKMTSVIPANIGIVKNAPNLDNAKLFIEYLLSVEGQEKMLDRKVGRLPVNPKVYDKAPKGYPNPFKDKTIGATVKFDVMLSKNRYTLVNSLYDVMITYRFNELKSAINAIHLAEKKLVEKRTSAEASAEAVRLITEAEELVAKLPITEAKANDPDFNKIFKKKRKKAKDIAKYVGTRQAQIEADWDEFVVANYSLAEKKAKMAIDLLR